MAAKPTTFRKVHTNDGSTFGFVSHECFAEQGYADELQPDEFINDLPEYDQSYMPDEVTKECARRMHYAAYRYLEEKDPVKAQSWKQKYFKLRDLIILGNQKLVYRAVQKFTALSTRSDDAIGDAFLVLINAVVGYNPWLGIRFSTYAFTCLMRGLNRMARKHLNDWLVLSATLDRNAEQDCEDLSSESQAEGNTASVLHYLHDDHPLLNEREKFILSRRFRLADEGSGATLQDIGGELGISKERVRQVQVGALTKLREEFAGVSNVN